MNAEAHTSSRLSPGYTLVELLVALTLFGLIALLMSGTFRFGARAWDAGARQIDRVGQVEAVQTLLRRELSQARLLVLKTAAPEPEPVFVGESGELRFAAPLSVQHRNGGLYIFRLGLSGSASSDLVVGWQTYRPDASLDDTSLQEQVVLLREVADIQLSYFGSLQDDLEPRWHSEWNDAGGLPDLVRVDLVFPKVDSRFWPSFVVSLRSGGGVSQ